MKKASSLLSRYRFRTLAVVTICLFGAGIVLFLYRPLPDVVVTRTAQGFVPAAVTIQKGQAVVFRSTGNADFWPASDFHPSHALYPEFDPKHALAPDESWRLVFKAAGVWTYHDHYEEHVRGTITVIGSPGESTRECLSHTATSSARAIANCWAVILTETLHTQGLQAAFDMYAQLYADNPSFRGLSCHDAGHILGAEAYKVYSDDHTVVDRPETSYCGFGFYHGFIETMLTDQGSDQYRKVRDYCGALKVDGQLNNASGACFHGIGHAAVDLTPGTLWGDAARMVRAALDVCEQALADNAERAQCSTGVFNAIAVASSAHTYDLSFSTADPLAICLTQQDTYRSGCYRELGIGAIRELKLDRAKTITFIESYRSVGGVTGLIGAYAGDEATRSVDSFDAAAFRALCTSFTLHKDRVACDRGVISGLRQGGLGNQYIHMFEYCSGFPAGTLRAECLSFAISQSRSSASDTAAFLAACKALPEPSVHTTCN